MENVSEKMKAMLKVQDIVFMFSFILVCMGAGVICVGVYIYHLINQTPENPADMAWLLLAGLAIAFSILLWVMMSKNIKSSKALTAKTLARYGNILSQIDTEVNAPSAIFIERMKLYMTENFMVSYAHGLDVIPWNEIAGVAKKWQAGSNPYLCIQDIEGVEHDLEYLQASKPDNECMIQVLEIIQERTS